MGKLKIGMIGVGHRGPTLLKRTILCMDDIEIVAVCDLHQDRMDDIVKLIQEKKGNRPFKTNNYHELLAMEEVEAVLISASWEAHIERAVAAMRAGKYTGLEVGGAYSIDDCWRLVRTYEETKTPCMLLENCCYGKTELMCLNMAKNGLFGEIVHCDGAYRHDLREEILGGNENRHYRLRNYTARNCENYPTHELGPIAKLLNINRGNRMISLVSVASKSVGLHDYAVRKKGADSDIAKIRFAQGDIVTTIIRCAGGETISLTLDTTLTRPCSRSFTVHGTEGYYEEATNSIYLEKDREEYGGEWDPWKPNWDNAENRYKELNHPLWKKYLEEGVKGGHGGMDWLLLRAFFESVKEKKYPPIDVYDAAAWMCISTLSEESIARGGLPVAIPDFTNGKWLLDRKDDMIELFCLRNGEYK